MVQEGRIWKGYTARDEDQVLYEFRRLTTDAPDLADAVLRALQGNECSAIDLSGQLNGDVIAIRQILRNLRTCEFAETKDPLSRILLSPADDVKHIISRKGVDYVTFTLNELERSLPRYEVPRPQMCHHTFGSEACLSHADFNQAIAILGQYFDLEYRKTVALPTEEVRQIALDTKARLQRARSEEQQRLTTLASLKHPNLSITSPPNLGVFDEEQKGVVDLDGGARSKYINLSFGMKFASLGDALEEGFNYAWGELKLDDSSDPSRQKFPVEIRIERVYPRDHSTLQVVFSKGQGTNHPVIVPRSTLWQTPFAYQVAGFNKLEEVIAASRGFYDTVQPCHTRYHR